MDQTFQAVSQGQVNEMLRLLWRMYVLQNVLEPILRKLLTRSGEQRRGRSRNDDNPIWMQGRSYLALRSVLSENVLPSLQVVVGHVQTLRRSWRKKPCTANIEPKLGGKSQPGMSYDERCNGDWTSLHAVKQTTLQGWISST